MNVNLRSVFLLMRSVLPLMMKRKCGSFISTSSIGGLPPVTVPLTVGYNTAKAGLIMLTKVAARQYAEYGIRVNTICPGYHRTSILPEEMIEEVEKALVTFSIFFSSIAAKGQRLKQIPQPIHCSQSTSAIIPPTSIDLRDNTTAAREAAAFAWIMDSSINLGE
jgi:NAD(P)-dependent dehydrogenase (short-subunit alcohol dehydrogenase family)